MKLPLAAAFALSLSAAAFGQVPPDGDTDADGVVNELEDLNGNGLYDDDDTDGEGVPDYMDPDDDGDGIPTLDEGGPWNDSDGDGIPNYLDVEGPAPPARSPLVPLVTCVMPDRAQPGSSLAVFGYENTASVPIERRVGSDNAVTKGAVIRVLGQTESFQPGIHPFGFTVRFTPGLDTLSWTLDGQMAMVGADVPPCTPPADVSGMLVLLPAGSPAPSGYRLVGRFELHPAEGSRGRGRSLMVDAYARH